MTPRKVARVIPAESARYWSLELGERGLHHFRFPTYDVAIGVAVATAPAFEALAPGVGLTAAMMAHMSPYMGSYTGVCWWHRAFDLVALPPEDWSAETARAYGREVVSELQEEGYSLLDILDLFVATQAELAKRIDVVAMAQARAVFSEPPGAEQPGS